MEVSAFNQQRNLVIKGGKTLLRADAAEAGGEATPAPAADGATPD